MRGFLLDTNVLSELMRPQPESKVVEFVRNSSDLWISVISIHEIAFGILRIPQGLRRQNLTQTLEELKSRYSQRILSIESPCAERAAAFRYQAQLQGKVCHLADSLIGATASTYSLVLTTRNLSDFQYLGLSLLNPWA